LVEEVIASSIDTSSFTRRKIPHYPSEVIREAVINAIIHRDYTIDEAKVFLNVKPDRIEVRSPGKPASPNTIEKLQNFTATQYSRNGRLANIFNKMGFMEEAEIGMETFKTLQEKHNFPSPVIKYQDPSVVVIFPRSLDAKRDLNDDLKDLNDEELKGYEYIQSLGEVSKSEYAEHFGYDDKKAYRHLSKMKKLELVGDNGESPKSNNYKYVYKAD
jgi:ATP-dependent DNA helicase RecG